MNPPASFALHCIEVEASSSWSTNVFPFDNSMVDYLKGVALRQTTKLLSIIFEYFLISCIWLTLKHILLEIRQSFLLLPKQCHHNFVTYFLNYILPNQPNSLLSSHSIFLLTYPYDGGKLRGRKLSLWHRFCIVLAPFFPIRIIWRLPYPLLPWWFHMIILLRPSIL